MIPRYSRPQMTAIWESQNRYRIWFEIEAHACDAQAKLGVIPKKAAAAICKEPRPHNGPVHSKSVLPQEKIPAL